MASLNEKDAVTLLQSAWRGQNTRNSVKQAHQLMPVLIIPAIAGSGLRIEASALGQKYVGERVWMNAAMLAMSRVSRHCWNSESVEQAKADLRLSLSKQQTFVEREAESKIKSAWLHHISLDSDMVSERKGNRVRPYIGLEGVEYMSDSAITQVGSWVHAPVVKTLLKLGYIKGKDLDAAPYDWRLPPSITEERDEYLTQTKEKIEQLYNANFRRPVILLCHSMGCKMGHYFLNWALQKHGQKWIDEHIYSYMPIGAPHCGVSLAVRAGLTGAGLSPEVDFLLADDSEGLILYRSWGSGGWLMPRVLPKHVVPSVVCRREGELAVMVSGPIRFGTLFRDRLKPPSELRLGIKVKLSGTTQPVVGYSKYVAVHEYDTELMFVENFYFAVPDLDEDKVVIAVSCFLEEPGGLIQSGSQLRRFTRWISTPFRPIKKALSATSRKIAKKMGTGARVGRTTTYTLRPRDFDENHQNILDVPALTKSVRRRFFFKSAPFKLKLKYHSAEYMASLAPNETKTHPVAAIETPTDQIPISNSKQKEVKYDALSGHQLFDMEGFMKIDQVINKFYEEDPVGPRTLDAPPVKRVNAIYGINIPTEVCAVYRHRSVIVVGDDKEDSRYVLDSACELDNGGKNCNSPWNWENLDIDGGKLFETKNTAQKTLNEKGEPVEIPCCGDGTVPYWNLAHCKTWRPHLKELTVDELNGAGHRGILADTRFHSLLEKYCYVENQRTAALLSSVKTSGQGRTKNLSSNLSDEETK